MRASLPTDDDDDAGRVNVALVLDHCNTHIWYTGRFGSWLYVHIQMIFRSRLIISINVRLAEREPVQNMHVKFSPAPSV
jgi:hypothetical protein